MKKTLLTIAFSIGLISLATVSHAQNGRFSVGAEVALPMGTFGDGASTGFGGSLRYEMPVNDNIGVMLTAGYLTFSGKDGGPSQSMIPIQLGAKYYFTENQDGFYGGVELGVHSSSVTILSETVTHTDFSYAPEVGYHLANIDLGLRYQFISSTGSTASYLGLRLAYVFGEK